MFFYVHPENWGRWTQVDEHIFQMGWFNHQLVNHDVIRGITLFNHRGPENIKKRFLCLPTTSLAWQRSRSTLEDWLELRFVCGWIWAVLLSKVNQDISPLLLSYFPSYSLNFSCLNPYVQKKSDSNLKRIGPTTHCLRLVQLVWGWESLLPYWSMNK